MKPVISALAILYRPCAWHTPKAELDALSRAYPGQVSHGLCSSCAAAFLAEDEATEAGR